MTPEDRKTLWKAHCALKRNSKISFGLGFVLVLTAGAFTYAGAPDGVVCASITAILAFLHAANSRQEADDIREDLESGFADYVEVMVKSANNIMDHGFAVNWEKHEPKQTTGANVEA